MRSNLSEDKIHKVILFIGPSGSGKTSLIRSLVSKYPQIFHEAVSTTSRLPRVGERDGIDYYFRNKLYFATESFLEQTYYSGNFYGLTCQEVIDKRKEKHLLAAVDINGLRQLQKLIGEENIISFFVWAPVETLRERMIKRGDYEEKIKERMENILKAHEWENIKYCDYKIDNDNQINDVLNDIERILKKENVL